MSARICPRCDSEKTGTLTVSPVKGAWELYQCAACLFMWRSTEPDTITDPKKYPKEFKAKLADLDSAGVMPSVPLLRKR